MNRSLNLIVSMEHRHRHDCARIGTILLIAALTLITAIRTSAQTPAYSYAARIGSTANEDVFDIAIDGNGNTYITGAFTGTVDFDPGAGTTILTSANTGRDIFVASHDPSGNFRWAFSIGGPPPAGATSNNRGLSIAVDGSGNVVVSGLFVGTMDFDPGAGTATLSSTANLANIGNTFVAKYTPTGTYLWAFKIGPWSNHNDVAVDASGNVVVVGTFAGTNDFDPGSGTASLSSTGTKKNTPGSVDMYVAKYSSNGAYRWAFKLGSLQNELAYSVDVDDAGSIYVTGVFGDLSTTVDFNPGSGTANLTGPASFVAKYTTAGAYAWAFKLGSSRPNALHHVAVDGSGNVVVAGGFRGTVDFDPGAGTSTLTSIPSSSGLDDIFVARYSSSGAYQWAFTPAAEGFLEGLSIDGNGDIHVTGSFGGPNDFDPGSGTVVLPTLYTWAAYAASYSAAGALQWAFSLPGAAYGHGIASSGGDVYVTGVFGFPDYPTVDFDPSEATVQLTSAGEPDIFIAKYTQQLLPKSVRRAAGDSSTPAAPSLR